MRNVHYVTSSELPFQSCCLFHCMLCHSLVNRNWTLFCNWTFCCLNLKVLTLTVATENACTWIQSLMYSYVWSSQIMKEQTGKSVWIDFFNASHHFEEQKQNIFGCSVLWKASGRTQNAENKDLESTPFKQSFQEKSNLHTRWTRQKPFMACQSWWTD